MIVLGKRYKYQTRGDILSGWCDLNIGTNDKNEAKEKAYSERDNILFRVFDFVEKDQLTIRKQEEVV